MTEQPRPCGFCYESTSKGSAANASRVMMYSMRWKAEYALYILLSGFIATGLVNSRLAGGPSGGVAALGLFLTFFLVVLYLVYWARRTQEEKRKLREQEEESKQRARQREEERRRKREQQEEERRREEQQREEQIEALLQRDAFAETVDS